MNFNIIIARICINTSISFNFATKRLIFQSRNSFKMSRFAKKLLLLSIFGLFFSTASKIITTGKAERRLKTAWNLLIFESNFIKRKNFIGIFSLFNKNCKKTSMVSTISNRIKQIKEKPSGWVGTPTQKEAKTKIKKLHTRVIIDQMNPKSLNIEPRKRSWEGRSRVKKSTLGVVSRKKHYDFHLFFIPFIIYVCVFVKK